MIDSGRPFDWGKTSADYAKWRDIYPDGFYERIARRGLCVSGQRVLDIGTGTGVLPRNMRRYGAEWTGVDASANQIAQAVRLSEGMDIDYLAVPAEELDFPDCSFDVVTACQCFWYFDHERMLPKLRGILKPNGRLLILYMAWLPYEDEIAVESERIVLKYNPEWTGRGETVHPIHIPDIYRESFETVYSCEYRLKVPFTRESWNGRMKSCRGVGASLGAHELEQWEREHLGFLRSSAPEEFDVEHYAAMAELKPLRLC